MNHFPWIKNQQRSTKPPFSYIVGVKLEDTLPRILEQITENRFQALLLAVSGGVDSICLAIYFIQNQKALGIKQLAIAHIHHGLRNRTADLDAELVKNMAEKAGIPFFLKKLDGEALKKQKGSLEENARKARYDALENFAREMLETTPVFPKKIAIVTAHHGNDQAETLYLRIRRGVSLAGLQGIQSIRKMSEGIDLYRPFLICTRKDILDYAREHHLKWREDETNSNEAFVRNRIRNCLLPHLEKTNPTAVPDLIHLANLAQKSYAKILQLADNFFSEALVPNVLWPFLPEYSPFSKVLALNVQRLPFENLTEILQSEIFRLWLDFRGFRLPVGERESRNASQSIRLKSILVEKCRNILWICDLGKASGQNNLYLIDGQNFSEKADGLRFRKTGDILWPADEKIQARKLTQWLHEKDVPRWMYDSLPLEASGTRILYVHGLRQR